MRNKVAIELEKQSTLKQENSNETLEIMPTITNNGAITQVRIAISNLT